MWAVSEMMMFQLGKKNWRRITRDELESRGLKRWNNKIMKILHFNICRTNKKINIKNKTDLLKKNSNFIWSECESGGDLLGTVFDKDDGQRQSRVAR